MEMIEGSTAHFCLYILGDVLPQYIVQKAFDALEDNIIPLEHGIPQLGETARKTIIP